MIDLTGKRVGSWLRVSTVTQARDGTGLDSQRDTNNGYIERRAAVFVDEYVERDGVSGLAEDRPDVDALVADVRDGRVEVALVPRIDRSARELRLFLNIVHEIEAAGGTVISASEDFDPTTPDGRSYRNTLAVWAERDRDSIVTRLAGGRRTVAKWGHWPGGVPPFGLARRRTEADKHTSIVLDERQTECIRTAAAFVVDDGLSPAEATARLNALGFRTAEGHEWTARNLRRTLLSSHLTGTCIKEGTAIPVPEILSPERHAEVRIALGADRPARVVVRSAYLLSRRMPAPCGRRYQGKPMGREKVRRYVCAGEDCDERCDCPRLDAGRIEERVWAEVRELLCRPERLPEMARDYLAVRGEQMGAEREQAKVIDTRIAKLERALRQTVIDYAREGVPAEIVRDTTAALTEELTELRRHKAELGRWRAANASTSKTMQRLWELAEAAHTRLDTMTDEDRARLLSMLDVRVTLTGEAECPECGGRGKVSGGDGRPTRRGGYRCGRCRGVRTLVDLRIEGTIMDGLGDSLRATGTEGHLVPVPSTLLYAALLLTER